MMLVKSLITVLTCILVWTQTGPALARGLKGKSIEITGNLSVSSYGGATSNLDFRVFTRAYIGKNGRFLYAYDKTNGGKVIRMGTKVSEDKKTYTLTLSKGVLHYKGKVRRTFFNYGFRLKLVPKGNRCNIYAIIDYPDPDITYGFNQGYSCRIFHGNVFAK